MTVTITSFAFVRTYRLITGDGNGWNFADHLDTHKDSDEAARQ